MITQDTRDKYAVTIGIECHVQLKTRTKLFGGGNNDAREAPPNTLIDHIDFALPGALPVLNKEAVRLACRAAFALGSEPQKFSKFDRKHYFYPDLPMGYQITQFDEPIIIGGQVEIEVDGQNKTVRITRAHMEADAGKSTHPAGTDYSLVDLNRTGTPLLEIVSEPDMHSAAEAKAYARELYLRMKYADVSDANLYYGNMRFDVNVSVSKTDQLGTRTETKNLNSFRSVEKAVLYEVDRQIELLEKGEKVVQETRGWDDAKQKTFSQRSKEDAHDYRYMPDPDLPPIVLDQAYIDVVKADMPALPDDYRRILSDAGLDPKVISDIVAVPDTAMTVKRVYEAAGASHAKRVAFWLLQPQSDDEAVIPTPVSVIPSEAEESRPDIQQRDLSTAAIASGRDDSLIKLSQMVEDNKLSSTAAKEVLTEVLKSGADPEKVAAEKNLLQVSDEGEIAKIVEQVLAENAKAAEDVKSGEMKAIGFLVGQVMKLSQGKANPSLAADLIKKQLGL
ncbi:MAG TPA: Asp-tRNA(Asn)/Glu-tRNA(Gln) amidotransferase subunit GatB [Candidatus Saccharimonadales bacterium]|nr:Asp-tRNA(Asn)/Glu-tRNA(Gln) amidotransferase subunit GatB [Candidatus Saccharimonadales bacterium]